MSQPSPDYTRNYSFTDHSAQQPNVPQPGSWLDIEFNDIKDILNNTGSRLSEIQQDDGKINGDAFSTYTYNQIAQSVATALNLEADYATKLYVTSQLSDYLQTSIAQSTFLTIATAASTYQPISGMSSYATQSWVESQGYLTGSLNYLPLAGGTLTGNLIVNGEGSSGHYESTEMFVTRTDAGSGQSNAYGALYNGGVEVGDINGNWAELTTAHLRFGDGSTQASAALPLTGGNVTGSIEINGEIVNIILEAGNGISVEYNAGSGIYISPDWVRFPDLTLQTTAGLPLTGGTMSGAIRFDNVGTQNIAKGSFDSGRGGYNGISLVCAVDYELNWQAGYLKALNSGGFNVPINVESDIVLSKYVETGEDLPPAHTITTTISLDGGISCNANDDFNDHNFNLHTDGVGGVPSSDQSWGLNNSGVGGDDGDNTFGLNSNGVGGFNSYRTWGINIGGAGGDNDDSEQWNISPSGITANTNNDTLSINSERITAYNENADQTWSFGVSGLTFADGTTMTTASGSGGSGGLSAGTISWNDYNATLDSGKIQFNETGTDDISYFNRSELKINHDLDFYSSLNNYRLYIQSDNKHIEVNAEGIGCTITGDTANWGINQSGVGGFKYDGGVTWVFNETKVGASGDLGTWEFGLNGAKFENGTVINSPSAGNSGLSQSGNIAHSDYPKEIQLVINGVTYAIPARIV